MLFALRLALLLAVGRAFADLMPPLSAASTSLMVVPEVAGSSAAVQPAPKAPSKKRGSSIQGPPEVVIERAAASWKPYSVRRAPRLIVSRSSFKRSKAETAARLHRMKDGDMLVISLYPESLKAGRAHLEVRYAIDEGFLQSAGIFLVRLTGAGEDKGDSFSFREDGVEFEEISPGSAKISVARLESSVGARSLNAGQIESAEFGDAALGRVDFRYWAKGVSGEAGPSGPSRRPRRR